METEQHVRKLRPETKVLESSKARIPLELILDIGMSISSNKKRIDAETGEMIEAKPGADGHNYDPEHSRDHDHDNDH